MNRELQETLQRIIARCVELEYDTLVSCSRDEIERTKIAVRSLFDFELPKDYTDVLHIVNGLDCGGLYIFGGLDVETNRAGIGSVVQENRILRADQRLGPGQFAFGRDEMACYLWNQDGQRYEVVTTGGSVLKSYENCWELLLEALETGLSYLGG